MHMKRLFPMLLGFVLSFPVQAADVMNVKLIRQTTSFRRCGDFHRRCCWCSNGSNGG